MSDGATSVRPPAGRRDRRTLALVASLALVGTSIAAFTSIYAAANRTTAAVVLVRPVAEGQPITAGDLGEARVTVPADVGYIPFSQSATLPGRRAVAAMPSGSLLTAQDLTDAPAIPADGAVVGVALKDGTFPAAGLSPGDQVLVVQTGVPGSPVAAPAGVTSASPGVTGPAYGSSGATGSGTSGVDTGVLVPRASVFAVTAASTSSGNGATLLVSLEVPSVVAAQVAAAAAAGQVGLVLLPPTDDAGSTPSTTTSVPAATTPAATAAGTVP